MHLENLPFMFLTGHSCLFDCIFTTINNLLYFNDLLFDWNPESKIFDSVVSLTGNKYVADFYLTGIPTKNTTVRNTATFY